MPKFLTTPEGRKLAYELTPGAGPGVVFLGGFKSDMEGSKATHLERWARAQGRAFLRFDYSGHGASSGDFNNGAIGDWAEDAAAAISILTDGPQVLVGSSMGGWISLVICTKLKHKISGFVGIAAAPDFTEDGYWAGFNAAQRQELTEIGHVAVPSDYGDPYIITRRLIEDGRDHLVLRSDLKLPFPVRLLQGTDDNAVSLNVATRLLEHIDGADVQLLLVKGADHSFSTPACLVLIEASLTDVLSSVR